MNKNIHDILLFLNIIHEFRESNGVDQKRFFFLVQDKIQFVQWDVDSNALLKLCISLNLLTKKNNRIDFTNKGLDIFDMSDSKFDLNMEQLDYIVENCFFNNSEFIDLIAFLKSFKYEKKFDSYIFDAKDYPVPKKLSLELLPQLKIVSIDSKLWTLNKKYIQFLELPKHKKYVMSQAQLESILFEQKQIGSLAEKLTLDYERSRLKKLKLNNESQAVKQISIQNANKGYDINSFSKKSSSLKPNLFIEVKARKHRLNSFIISSNELQIAKELKKQYAIYFWNNLNSKTKPISPTQIIMDPFNTLKIQECENCLNYLISLEE